MARITDSNAYRAAGLRMALSRAGFESRSQEPSLDFEVKFSDNTTMDVAFTEGTITVARVMPSGNVTGNAVFVGLPLDIVEAAVVALATEMEA